jgi:hypothetical protein
MDPLSSPIRKPTEAGGLDVSDELVKLPPSRWYLTAFLAPMEARELPEPTDDEIGAGSDEDAGDAASADAGPKRKHFLPASIGLSVLLPPPAGPRTRPGLATGRVPMGFNPWGTEIRSKPGGRQQVATGSTRGPRVKLGLGAWL